MNNMHLVPFQKFGSIICHTQIYRYNRCSVRPIRWMHKNSLSIWRFTIDLCGLTSFWWNSVYYSALTYRHKWWSILYIYTMLVLRDICIINMLILLRFVDMMMWCDMLMWYDKIVGALEVWLWVHVYSTSTLWKPFQGGVLFRLEVDWNYYFPAISSCWYTGGFVFCEDYI